MDHPLTLQRNLTLVAGPLNSEQLLYQRPDKRMGIYTRVEGISYRGLDYSSLYSIARRSAPRAFRKSLLFNELWIVLTGVFLDPCFFWR